MRRDFTFKSVHGALPIRDELYKRGMTRTRLCPSCPNTETQVHLLYECEPAKLLRNDLRQFLKAKFLSWQTIIYLKPLPVPLHLIYATIIVITEIKYQLWKSRNARIFEQRRDSAKVILERVRFQILRRANDDLYRLPELNFDAKWCDEALPYIKRTGKNLELLF